LRGRAAVSRLGPRDALAIAAIVAFALLLIMHSGFKRAVELLPWPDGLEYAAVAVNLDQGSGPVLHFGGYSYPSRYTEGYPLILAAAYPIVGHDAANLVAATIAMAILALIALYVLAIELFDRPGAIVATILLAISPVFVTYSTLVLSDVPTLAVTTLAALALARATFAEQSRGDERASRWAYWGIFGLLAGFSVMIRSTNATILVGLAAALAVVRPESVHDAAASIAAFAIGFLPLPLWQLHENAIHLGGAFKSGYAWWVPEVYGSFTRTFNPAFLFGPTMPRNPRGNVPVYFEALLGLDGFSTFKLYPFAAAVFAIVGLVALVGSQRARAAMRTVVFGLGYLAALLGVYLLYVFTDIVFIIPGAFVLFALAGYGASIANRRLGELWEKPNRTSREHAIVAVVIALDILILAAAFSTAASRLTAPERPSRAVPAILELGKQIAPDAAVISNISLQFLELYLPARGRSFVGMHSFDPGGELTDYHLHRLYVKRSRGWRGPVPPVMFESSRMMTATAGEVASRIQSGRAVYLLLWEPNSEQYAALLKQELGDLAERFTLTPVKRIAPIELYRLSAR
jgi:4-amino-4-deoxy-L-arabinose transferase-like glycosyltransferase